MLHMKVFIIGVCLTLILTVPAFGFSWTYHDFGPTVFDHNNNTCPVSFPEYGALPSPGTTSEGGEKFDIEGVFYAEDEIYMYMGLTSSYGSGAESFPYGTFESGDIFFGFGPDMYDFAIDIETKELYAVDTWNYVPDIPGSYGAYPSIKEDIGAYRMVSGQYLGATDWMLTFEEDLETNPLMPPYDASGDTYVWEFMFEKSLLGERTDSYGTITIHNTLACGNDLVEEGFDCWVPDPDPDPDPIPDPVPEPATLLLLGSGLIGLMFLRRKKT